jgi:hypothetical protein
MTPAPSTQTMKDATRLAEFLMLDTLTLCKQLAGFTIERVSDLFGIAVERL